MEILELKITIFENLKIHWMGLTKRKRKTKKRGICELEERAVEISDSEE